MERQGTCIHNHVNSRQYVGASMHVLVFLAVLFSFVVSAWSQCVTIDCATGGSVDYAYSLACPNGVFGRMGVVQGCGANYGGSYYCATSLKKVHSTFGTFVACPTQCQATEAYCRDQGLDFDADSCKCKLPCPESVCDAYKAQCENVLMGTFTGRCERSGAGGEPCCNGYCDICSGPGIQGNYNEMKKICCGQFKAPPAIGKVCWQNPAFSSGCHVYQSTVRAPDGEQWACHDPNQSQEMMDRYTNECFGGSSSSTGGSSGSGGSSGGGNSSGEGGGSSGGTPPYPEGCDECPWLDSILDTLIAQKGLVEQIYFCVKYPSLCDNAEDSQQIEIDSNILNGVKDLIDSNLELSREQIEKLLKLDTNLLKMLINDTTALKLDSALLKSDSNTRKAIVGGFGSLESTTNALNDSTRKWLKRIADSASAAVDSNRKYLEMVADSIGITAESLKVHLDSIKNAIPKDILDSIFKYQKEGSNDSIVISSLPGLDSILDSTISYWKKSQKADSARHVENNDTARAIHEAIDGIGLNIGAVLGYGDTATSDLHEDMLNVKGSILGFLDSALKYWQERHTFDSSYRESIGQSIVDVQGSVDSSTRAIFGVRDAVGELRDSSIKYLKEVIRADSSYRVQFGEKMGDVQGAVNAVKGSVDGVKDAVDGVVISLNDIKGVIGDGVSGWDSAGIASRWRDSVSKYAYTESQYSAYYDSVSTSWGADTLDRAWDDSFGYGECVGNDCPPCTDDSCMGRVTSNLVRHGDSVASELGARLEESVRNQRDSLPSFLDSTFQELKKYSWFGSFDSTFLSNIGAKIPNTNTCPEHCFKLDVNDNYTNVPYNLRLDWKLCRPIAPQQLNNLNAFDIIKLLARILTVVTCISIIMWDVSSSRGKIGL